jgi:translation initiation factor 1
MNTTRLVYSTEGGRTCPTCRQAQADCRCAARTAAQVLGDGKVRVSRSSAGRGGKLVTVVQGLPLTAAELEACAKRLKAACGSGGTAKEGRVEIQGDHVDRVMKALQAEGYAPKRAGA